MRLALFVIRGLFFALSVGTGAYVASVADAGELTLIYVLVAMALAGLVIFTEVFFSKSPIQLVSAIVFGTMLGVAAAWLFTGMIQVVSDGVRGGIGRDEIGALRLALTLVFVYFGITLILQTKDDFRFIVPFVEFRREVRGERPFVLDTSALIDGRFTELLTAGLVDAPVLVPRFVVDELQALADSKDKGKRSRGRRGLDLLAAMKRGERFTVEVIEAGGGDAPVDRRLVAICAERAARLVTTDAALQKLAELEAVPAINLHRVAKAFQLQAQSGERLELKLVRKGEGEQQAVGYLDDGALVVVEEARSRVGETVTVEITSALRTRTGQMFFARLAPDEGSPKPAAGGRAPEEAQAAEPGT